jgi:hypothetical protein
LAILGEHAHVSTGNQKDDLLAPALIADVEMTETAEVAESDAAFGVEAVATNAVIDLGWGRGRRGFEARVEGLERRAATKGAMRSQLVIDGAEGIELELEMSNRVGGRLLGEKELQSLVEAFDLAAGLGVIGRGVNTLDAEAVEL